MISIERLQKGLGVNSIKAVFLLLIFGPFLIFSFSPPGEAAVPRYINYQGKLTDTDDMPVTDTLSITVRLYAAETGGSPLWTEIQEAAVENGIFSILLGSTTSLSSLDFNSPYWYSVEIESDGEMTPRQRLTAIGYALNADKLDGYDASSFLRSDADTTLTGSLTVSGNITGSANEDINIDPTGSGDVIISIDSTSGDFKITDGTTNWLIVDSATGNVTLSNDLTVNGTIYGTLASTGGNSTFTSITVTGTSDLRGNISSSTGAVTIADTLTQTGSTNQVTFAGNIDANNGVDVTGTLTVSGQTTLSSALDMNSNIDLDYSGTSPALDVTQSSTGAGAQFSGGRVIVGTDTTNAYALSSGELYVQGDLEVDGTIYGNVSSSGDTSLGSTTLSSLTVSGTSDLQGNVSDSGGVFTIADNLSIAVTDSSTSGTATIASVEPVFQDSGADSTTTAVAMKIAPTVNYTGGTKSGSYTALKVAAVETSLPTGTNYLIDARAGADGTTQKFYVDNSGNTYIAGTLNMNSQKITSLAAPVAGTDAATKAYADSLTPASAGGWTDGGTGLRLIEATDNVGIGTSDTGSYKLNVNGEVNTTSLYIGGTQVTSTAGELNKLDGAGANVTAANLNTLTGAGSADALHTHTSGLVVTSPDSTQTISGDTQIDTTGADTLGSVTQTNATTSLAIATNTAKAGAGAGADSDGVLKLGINEGNYQYIWYDTDAGTDGAGAFLFSDQAVIPTASPAYLNFGMDKDVNGKYTSYYALKMDPDPDSNVNTTTKKFSVVSIPNPGANWQNSEKPLFDVASDGSFNIYDPALGDAVFQIEPGGRLAHDFRNMVKNGSFEAFSGFSTYSGYDPNYSTSGTYNNTTTGYKGGWSNFAPDEWVWVEGKIVQHSPALFTTSSSGTYNTDFYDGKSAVGINEWSGKRNLNYVLESPDSSNDAGIKQTIKGLEPNTWYSIGTAMMVTNAATTKAILDITGEYKPTTTLSTEILIGAALNGSSSSTITVASTANFPSGGTLKIDSELFDYTGKSDTTFTGVTRNINSTTSAAHSAAATVKGIFKPLISDNTTFEATKGTFKTDSIGSDIVVYLLCQQTSGATDYDFARFDGVQLVEGKALPKYTATSIIDIGDQSIYGTLKLGRSADGRGGILSVDQYVRTRGIDFFSDDPGMSGTTGGSGSIGVPYSLLNMVPYSDTVSTYAPGTNYMDTSGYYIDPSIRKFQVRVQGTSYSSPENYVKYRYATCTDPLREAELSSWSSWSSWYPSSSSIAISTTYIDLVFGIKVKFGSLTGHKAGDQWEFKAYGSSSTQGTYDSYNKQATYKPGAARIYKDTSTGELTFEDNKSGKVKLSEVISQKSAGYISPPVRDPANTGTLNITASGSLDSTTFTSGQTFEIALEWDSNNLPTRFWWQIKPQTTGTYAYDGNWGINMNRGSTVSLVTSATSTHPSLDTGIDITFPATGSVYNYERWTFYASPGSASNVASHGHANSLDGGTLTSPGTTASTFGIGTATDPNNANISLNFGIGTTDPKYIKWNKDYNRFDVSDNITISGTLVATNISGVASATHTHPGTDITSGTVSALRLPTAGTGTAGIIPSTGLTNVMVSDTASIVDTKLATISTADKVSGSAVQLNSSGAITNSTGLKVNLASTNAGLAITANALDVKLAANKGLTKTADGIEVDYDNSTIGIVSNKLALTNSYSSGSAYDTRFVNISGDTMTGALNLGDNGLTVGTSQLAVSGGNVGIGTIAPSFKLDVNGIVNATALYVNGAQYVGSQWSGSGNDLYYTTGNVGIGTAAPGNYKLNINGNTNITGNLEVTGTVTAAGLSGTTTTSGTDNDTFAIDADYSGTNPALRFQMGAAAYKSVTYDETNTEFDFDDDINITGGITTSNGLTVSGGTVSLPNNSITDAFVSDTLTASDLIAGTAVVADSEVVDALTISGGTINAASVGATAASTGAFTTLTSTQGTTLATASGNVGIGTVAPTALLVVGNNAFKVASNGTVSAGTWQGTAVGDTYVADALTISGGTINNTVIGGTVALAGTFTNLTASGTVSLPTDSITDAMVVNTVTASNYVPLAGGVNVTGALNIGTTSGNVGIGTAVPGNYKLNVNGNTNITGNLEVSGTVSATGLAGATSTSGTNNDTFAIDANYDGTNPGLRFQTGAAAYKSIIYDETNTEFDFDDDINVTGTVTASNGLTISAGTLSLPADSVTDTMVSNTLTASDLVAGSAVVADSEVVDALTISGGTINATSVGATVASTGAFTTLSSTQGTNLATTSGNVGIGTVAPTALLAVGNNAFKVASNGTVSAGTWQGTAVGDTYVADVLTISGGTINNTIIGGTVSAAGTFTNLTASGTLSLPNNSVTDAMVSNTLTASDLAAGSAVVADSEVVDTLTISGGTINNTAIGATVAATGTFTNLTASGTVSLPADSITDAMVVNTLTASNYVPLAGGVNVTGALNISTTSGNVGIGTASPGNYKLYVNGNTSITGNLEVTGTVTAAGLSGTTTTSGTDNDTFAIDANYDGTNPELRFQTGSGTYKSITYDETNTEFDFNDDINLSANQLITTGNLSDGTNTLTVANAKTAYDHSQATSGSAHGLTLANVSELGSAIESSEITDGTITSSDINDGTIMNTDVNVSAEIAGTKIAPNFGSQTVLTTGNVGIGTIVPTSKLHGLTTMSTATGNETAYELAYTTNKATSGNDTGLLIAMTDTLSPGTSRLLDLQVGGNTKFNVDNAGNTDIQGNLVVAGDLTIQGTQTILNTQTVEIESNELKLNRNVTGAPSLDASITVERGTSADTYIKWDEANDKWVMYNGTSILDIANPYTAGDGLTLTGQDFDVNVDASTIEINADTLRVKDSGITSAKIASDTIVAGDIATGAVETTEILDGTIANADVNASAAIAGTKISPDFGSQVLVTTGNVGIGTVVTSSHKLNVLGDTNITGNLEVSGTVTAQGLAGATSTSGTNNDTFAIDANYDGVNPALRFQTGAGTYKSIIYDETNTEFDFDDAVNVTGGITASNGLTLSAGTLSLPADSITDAMVSNTLTASDLTAGSAVVADSEVVDALTISGGTINATSVGAAVASTGAFTTLLSTQGTNLATASGNVGIGTVAPTALLAVGNNAFKVASNGTVSAGTWNGTAVGDTYVADTLTISGGTINNTAIGGTVAAAGTFTNLTASGTVSLPADSITDALIVDTLTASNYVPLAGGVDITGALNIGTTSGNVGIGTAVPGNYKLNVNGPVNISGNLDVTGTVTAAGLAGSTSTNGTSNQYFVIDSDYNEVNPELRFQTGAGAYKSIAYDETGTEFDINDDINLSANALITTGNLSDGTNTLTVANAKTAYDHSQASSGSVHGLTLANVSQLGTAIESGEITNDTIVNTDINASAGIAGTKIAPDFGSQNILTTGNIGVGTVVPTSKLHGLTTMGTATGNETAYELAYTTNKATSGNDTGLLIAMTDTLSPGTSRLLDLQVGGGTKFNVDNAGNTDIQGNLVVAGDLTIQGTQTILNTQTVEIESNELKLNRNVTGAPSLDASIIVERGTSSDTYIKWDEANDKWVMSNGTTVLDIANPYTAGDGLTLTGQDFDVNVDASTIEINADTLRVKDAGITSAKIASDTIVAGDIATGAVETTEILDGTVANVDVNASAAIAGTKISPDFGSQVLVTTGNVGIGTVVTSSYKLNVLGNTNITGNLEVSGTVTAAGLAGATSTSGTNNDTFAIDANYDGVNPALRFQTGAGTYKSVIYDETNTEFDFDDDINVTGGVTVSNGLTVSAGTLSLPADSITNAMVSDTLTASDLTAGSSVVSDAEVDNNLTISGGIINASSIGGTAASTGAFTTLSSTSATNLATTSGNVGIGTVAPTALLAVGNNAFKVASNGTVQAGTWQGTAVGDTYVADALTISGGTINNTAIGGTVAAAGTFTNLTASGTVSLPNNSITDAMVSNTLTASDLVSGSEVVADSEVSNNLTISGGTINATSVGATVASTGAFTTLSSTQGANLATASGNVGIGTIAPATTFHARGTRTQGSNMNEANVIIGDTSGMEAGVGGRINFEGKYTTAGVYAGFSSIEGGKENATDSNYAGYLAFGTRANGGNVTEKARIDSAGNVGIGTTAPGSYKLNVNGPVNISGALDVTGTVTASGLAGATSTSGTTNQYFAIDSDFSDVNPELRFQTGSGAYKSIAYDETNTEFDFNDDINVTGSVTTSNGLTVSAGTVSLPADSITNAMVSDTLTASDLAAGSAVVADSEVVDALTISGGTINATSVGATVASTGAFTTLSSTQGATLATASGNIGIGTIVPTSKVHGLTTMGTATGNETAYELAYTTNKATSGNDTGLLIAMTDTLSPGTSRLLDLQVGGGTKFNVDNAGNTDIQGNLVVQGDLSIQGTQTILNTQTVEIESNELKLNRNVTGAPSLDASIVVERGTSSDTYIKWDEANDKWVMSNGTSVLDIANPYTAGDGLTLTGQDFDVNVDASTIEISGDTLQVKDAGITSAKIAGDTIIAGDIATGAVETTEILDGTIANVDINASAGIAGTKISPDFGSQVLVTTGNVGIGTVVTSSYKLNVLGNTNITGNLEVSGTVTAAGLAGATSTSGTNNDTFAIDADYNGTNPGLRFQTGAGTYKSLIYDETNTEFDFDDDINLGSNNLITSGSIDGVNISGFATGGSIDHTKLINVGTYTHSQIDSHIVDTSDPHGSAMSISASITTPIVYGSGSASGNLTIESTSNAAKGNILMPSGNIGIGTTSPSVKLEVAGGDMSIDSNQKINVEGSSGDTYMKYNSTTGHLEVYVNGEVVAYMKN